VPGNVKSGKVSGGMVSPSKVYPETVVKIETQPGWGGVDGIVFVPGAGAGGVGAGVVAGVVASSVLV
jgi:hypothetical protein